MTQKESKEKSQTVGVCKFCGQSRVYDYTPEDPDLEATRDCHCYEGGPWREREKVLNAAEQNIDAMFGDHFPEVAEAFQALKENVYDGKIGRITIKLPGGATARLWMPSASAMKVDFKQTTVTELSTGL